MIFREFTREDVHDISEIFQLIYNDKRKSEDYLKWLDYPQHCKNFVVENESKVIGRLLLDQFYFYYPELVNFVIHPKYQGQGIGQKLVQFAIQKCSIADQDSLVIPILKNEYADYKVRKFYDKMDFKTVVQGNKELNEWRMNFQNYSLIKSIKSQINPSNLSMSSILTNPSPYFRRFYSFDSNSKEEMIKHIKICRTTNRIIFKNKENELASLTIIGQPDQLIGRIGGMYCIPAIPPAINGIELSNKNLKFKIAFQNVNEIGNCELYFRNNGINEETFNLEAKMLSNVKISGVPKYITLLPNEESIYKIEINLEEKFDHNIFNFTSFESIPLTIIFKHNKKIVNPFQLTIHFWYRLLERLQI